MKIALVSVFPPSMGSLNEYGYHLALGLAANPKVSEVVVLADIMDEPKPELDLPAKIKVARVWKFNSLNASFKILRALKSAKVDGAVYNVQTASFGDREVPAALGLMTPSLATKFGITSGVLAHNIIEGIDLDQTILKGNAFRKLIVKLGGRVVTKALASASYITVTVQNYLDKLEKIVPSADAHLVPHGNFETEARDWVPMTSRPKRIVTMGKFGTYKKLDRLIEAFSKLTENQDFADYELVIGGTDHPNTPGYMSSLEEAHKNNSSISFRGYIPEEDVAPFFENAQLAVFDYEATTGSSGVLHQVCSYGTVPIFPMIGEFIDLSNDEGIDGFEFAPGNADSMAEALKLALSDVEKLEAIANNNALAGQELSIEDVAAFHVSKIEAINSAKSESTSHKTVSA